MTVLIGADPEILLVDNANNMRSVEGLCGGTKDVPVPIPQLEDGFEAGYAMQEDNVMLEFNVPPARTWDRAEDNVNNAMFYLQQAMVPHALSFHGEPSAEYDVDQLATAQAATFGCSPDLDAYENGQALGVTPSALGNTRCAGGHIHLGFDNKGDIPPFVVAQLADAMIGLWEVYFGKSQGIRRRFYGTAGRYRVKPYGIEYRTPSNNWLFHADMRHMMMRSSAALGHLINDGDTNRVQKLFTELPRQEIARAINGENQTMAKELSKFMQIMCEEVECDI